MKDSLKTKLQIRFVLISVAALFVLLGLIVSVSIYNGYSDMVKKSDTILEQVRHNQSLNVRFFSVKVHPAQSSVRLDVVQHVTVTQNEAAELAGEAIKSGKDRGFLTGYRYHITKHGEEIKVWFLSRAASIDMFITSAENLIIISFIGLAVTFILLVLVSGLAVKPIVENHRKQKEFITAASHELRTPLTVISTDIQLLQSEIGENEWIDGILTQVDHLTEMTHGLVTLAKSEEFENPVIKEKFSLSDTVFEAVDMYTGLREKGKISFNCEIPPDISYLGNQKELHQLLCVLLDNAFKYCPEYGEINVQLKQERRHIYLSVSNTTDPLTTSDLAKLPERFYRGQNATSKDGFGLGLSIADAIAKRYKGKLTLKQMKKDVFTAEVTLH